MTDDKHDPTPETEPVRPTASESTSASDPDPVHHEPTEPPRRGLRDRFAGTGDRLRGTSGLIAATLAALVIGGLGGAAIHAAVDDRDDRGGFSRGEHPNGPHHGERGVPGGPGRLPGMLPPPMSPEGEVTPPTPEDG